MAARPTPSPRRGAHSIREQSSHPGAVSQRKRSCRTPSVTCTGQELPCHLHWSPGGPGRAEEAHGPSEPVAKCSPGCTRPAWPPDQLNVGTHIILGRPRLQSVSDCKTLQGFHIIPSENCLLVVPSQGAVETQQGETGLHPAGAQFTRQGQPELHFFSSSPWRGGHQHAPGLLLPRLAAAQPRALSAHCRVLSGGKCPK